MVNSKNKWTLSAPVGAVAKFSPGPVGAVCNRTGLECLINSKPTIITNLLLGGKP